MTKLRGFHWKKHVGLTDPRAALFSAAAREALFASRAWWLYGHASLGSGSGSGDGPPGVGNAGSGRGVGHRHGGGNASAGAGADTDAGADAGTSTSMKQNVGASAAAAAGLSAHCAAASAGATAAPLRPAAAADAAEGYSADGRQPRLHYLDAYNISAGRAELNYDGFHFRPAYYRALALLLFNIADIDIVG
jgi:hypothetical protein